MRKILVIIMLAAVMLYSPVSNKSFAAEYENPILMENPAILQNVIARLMIGDLQKAVDDYYSEYTDYLPHVEVYAPRSSTEILCISYNNNDNVYTVKIKVDAV